MSQNESNPPGILRPAPVRRKRRKKTPWQKFKEAYLPLILVLVGLAVVVALIIGLVKAGQPNPGAPGIQLLREPDLADRRRKSGTAGPGCHTGGAVRL